MEHITVELVDREAAMRGDTRRDVFRKLAAGGTVATGGLLIGGLPSVALGQSASGDAAILNFALLLEYLESEFYVEAVNSGALTGDLLEFATVVRDHELAHVNTIRGGARQRRRRQADVRLPRHDEQPGPLPGHRTGARGHGRGGL